MVNTLPPSPDTVRPVTLPPRRVSVAPKIPPRNVVCPALERVARLGVAGPGTPPTHRKAGAGAPGAPTIPGYGSNQGPHRGNEGERGRSERAHRAGGAGAQPARRQCRTAARPAHRRHRALGLREVVARLRHHLCGGAAPLRRVALRLRAAVPRRHGEARRRRDRGALARHRHRAAHGWRQPALHRRHRHRDLRLPAPPVGPRRHPPLSLVRASGASAVAVADRRADPRVARRRPHRGPRSAGEGAQGRVPRPVRAHAERRLRARTRGWRTDRPLRPAAAEPAAEPRYFGRRGPAHGARLRPRAARRLRGDCAPHGRRRRRGRPARGGWGRDSASVQRALRVSGVRARHAGTRAAAVLLQLSVRRLSRVRRARLPARAQRRPHRRRGPDLDPRGRPPSHGDAERERPPPPSAAARAQDGVRPQHAVGRTERGPAGGDPLRRHRRGLGGGDRRHPAPLPRDDERARAPRARGIHDALHLPRLRGRPAAPREPGRHAGGTLAARAHRAVRGRTPPPSSEAGSRGRARPAARRPRSGFRS